MLEFDFAIQSDGLQRVRLGLSWVQHSMVSCGPHRRDIGNSQVMILVAKRRQQLAVAAMKDSWSRVVSEFVGRIRSASHAAIRTCQLWPADHSTSSLCKAGVW